jgi:hypothetical protein
MTAAAKASRLPLDGTMAPMPSKPKAISEWRAVRNAQALRRLRKALPVVFPAPVLTHALARAFTPPMPRLAVDSYWRSHPIRADRLARALALRSGAPGGWIWRLTPAKADGLPLSFRTPPAPYREAAFARGPGHCCVCGQPVYRFGWHVDLWDAGPSKTAAWHSACVVAWKFWNAPTEYTRQLKRLQCHRCAETGGRLWKTAEIDHRVPLFRVWRDMRDAPWPELLAHWGVPNLQVINRDVHAIKCASEANHRAQHRSASLALTTAVSSIT